MTKEQEEQSVRLMEKYGFDEEMSVSKEQSRFIALILGIAYELSDKEIAKYMDVESKNFTDVDLRRISAMQMEKAIDIYKLKEKCEKKHRFK